MRMMAWLEMPGLGSLPERTELHPVITGIVEHDEINQQTSNKRGAANFLGNATTQTNPKR